MSPTVRLQISVNLGASVAVEVVASAITDLNTVCQFGGALQDGSSRNRAINSVFGASGRYLGRGGYPVVLLGSFVGATPGFEEDVAGYLREFDLDRDGLTYVSRLTYENPLTAELLVAAEGAVVALLVLLGNWPSVRQSYRARARSADARARAADAVADDYESQVAFRKEVRGIVLEGLRSSTMLVTNEQVDALLTGDVVGAMQRLGNSEIRVSEVDSDS